MLARRTFNSATGLPASVLEPDPKIGQPDVTATPDDAERKAGVVKKNPFMTIAQTALLLRKEGAWGV